MAIETKTSVDVRTLPPFKRFIMSIGALPTSYLESMSYAELLMWFCNFLQEQVIPAVNNNAEAVNELQNLFVELKEYVDNYFESTDFQELVNNKLDEMAEDGTLENLINNSLNLMRTYNTFQDLIEDKDTFVNNTKLKTLGYYSINDGGQAEYYVTNVSTDYFQYDLENGLYLVLMDNYEMNVKQFGAKGDGINDDTDSIQNALDFCFRKGIDLKIPSTSNYYKITEPLILQSQPGDLNDQYWAGNGTRLFGEYKTRCKIIKIGNTTSGLQNYDVNATLICVNNSSTGINIENLTIGNYSDNNLNSYDNDSYAIYTKVSRSNYKDLNLYAYHGLYGSCFSSNFENIVFGCTDTALNIENGTSNTFRFIYAPECHNPYRIRSSYSTLLNCANDLCTGSIYRLGGVGLTLLNCGCESKHAQYIIEQENIEWTNITIQGMMIDRQIGDSDNDLDVGDCALIKLTTSASFKLRDVTIIEREYISSENDSYIFKLPSAGLRINTVVDNLTYLKNYSGNNNKRMKLWNNYSTEGYTPHTYSSGGMTFNYQLIGEGTIVPFIGGFQGAQSGTLSSNAIFDNKLFNKAIYFDTEDRYLIHDNISTQYIGRPNLGDIHIFNDPLAKNALADVVTNITNSSLYTVSKVPIVKAVTTANRPTTNLYAGLCIYDTTLKKPIWWDGINQWRDSSGTLA